MKSRETFLLNKDQVSKLVKEINILKRQQMESKKQLNEQNWHNWIEQPPPLSPEKPNRDAERPFIKT